jgi:ribosomal protein S20
VTVKGLDKAAARRVIHPNQAARRKSQLARLLEKKPARA